MTIEAMKQIADIAEGSTTANSLQHIAKIARQAIAEAEKQEPVDLKAIRLVFLETDHPADKTPKEIQEAFVTGWNGALDALAKRGALYTSQPAVKESLTTQQEPVAFITPLMEQQMFDDWCPYKGNPDPRVVWASAVDAVNGVLLGATPPQRQPLTDEQLRSIENTINQNMRWRSSDEEGITLYPSEYYDLVRAIEAAHGIKGEA